MKIKTSELKVILETKKLCAEVMKATFNAPKQYRFSIVAKLQNLSLEILETLYRSNEVFVLNASPRQLQQRIDMQQQALSQFNVLSYMLKTAHAKKCITNKQHAQISDIINTCTKLTGGWIKSEINAIINEKT